MKVQEMKLTDIKPYENNPRKNDEAVQYVANSIREFGFQQPIVVDKDKTIVVGHTRYKAAQELGLETVPVVVADELTEEQVKAYRLADNKVAEAAGWDFIRLDEELGDLGSFDMSIFGFDESALSFDETKERKEVKLNEGVYQIIIDCVDEFEAENIYNQIKEMGIECRISTL